MQKFLLHTPNFISVGRQILGVGSTRFNLTDKPFRVGFVANERSKEFRLGHFRYSHRQAKDITLLFPDFFDGRMQNIRQFLKERRSHFEFKETRRKHVERLLGLQVFMPVFITCVVSDFVLFFEIFQLLFN